MLKGNLLLFLVHLLLLLFFDLVASVYGLLFQLKITFRYLFRVLVNFQKTKKAVSCDREPKGFCGIKRLCLNATVSV